MIGYVMVGARDIAAATKFYDALLAPLGLVRDESDDTYVAYGPADNPGAAEFFVTTPYNGEPATAGNGTMIALQTSSRALVDEFHAVGLEIGGTDEGKPGCRPEGATEYYAYIRDPDGNKICGFTESEV